MSGPKPLDAAANSLVPALPPLDPSPRTSLQPTAGPVAQRPVDSIQALPPANKGRAPSVVPATIAAFNRPEPVLKPWEKASLRLDVQIGTVGLSAGLGEGAGIGTHSEAGLGLMVTLSARMDWDDPRAWHSLFDKTFGPPEMTEADARKMVKEWGGNETDANMAAANFLAERGKYADAAALYLKVITDSEPESLRGAAARQRLALMFNQAAEQAANVAATAGARVAMPDSVATPAALTESVQSAGKARAEEAKVLRAAGRLYQDAMAAPPPAQATDEQRRGYADSRRDMLANQLDLCARLQKTAAGFADLTGRTHQTASLPVANRREDSALSLAFGETSSIAGVTPQPVLLATQLLGMGQETEAAALSTLQEADKQLVAMSTQPEVQADAAGALATKVQAQRLAGPAALLDAAGEPEQYWASRVELALVATAHLNALARNGDDARTLGGDLHTARDKAAQRLLELCRTAPLDAAGAAQNAGQLLRAWEALLVTTQDQLARSPGLANMSPAKQRQCAVVLQEAAQRLLALAEHTRAKLTGSFFAGAPGTISDAPAPAGGRKILKAPSSPAAADAAELRQRGSYAGVLARSAELAAGSAGLLARISGADAAPLARDTAAFGADAARLLTGEIAAWRSAAAALGDPARLRPAQRVKYGYLTNVAQALERRLLGQYQ